jgi:membrane dipeptidase
MSSADQAQQIYEKAIVIDALNVSNWNSPAVYQSLRASGITALNATSAVWENYREGLDQIAAWQHHFSHYSDILVQIRTAGDILQAKEDRKVGIIIGWQNASPIENDLKRLALFHQLGLRIVQITYNERNLLGNGCYERRDEGLSHFGVDAIREMNRLGILVDLSHVGDRTTLEAIEVSEQPVAFTHANARASFDHVRNKTDEALEKVAAKGGVIGANAFPIFLPRGFGSTLADYADTIDDLVERVGVDHVGVGTDYTQDQPQAFFDWLFARQGTGYQDDPLVFPDPMLHPQGMETPDKFAHISVELLERGYSEENTGKILGGNWLRLFREVWK